MSQYVKSLVLEIVITSTVNLQGKNAALLKVEIFFIKFLLTKATMVWFLHRFGRDPSLEKHRVLSLGFVTFTGVPKQIIYIVNFINGCRLKFLTSNMSKIVKFINTLVIKCLDFDAIFYVMFCFSIF